MRDAMCAACKFQSTLPRGERLGVDGLRVLRRAVVSIHAPTWGATKAKEVEVSPLEVSIHAPTWGATRIRGPDQDGWRCFNPRSHVGSDMALPINSPNPTFQSTLPRGERHPAAADQHATLCFNPRSHVGSDYM